MKLTYLFFFIVVFATANTHAQTGNVLGGSAAKGVQMNVFPYGTISTFGLAEKITTGDNYLYDQWRPGTITTDKGEIQNCPLNIDLKNHIVEINTDQGIKTLAAGHIKRITVGFPGVAPQVFENASAYKGAGNQLSGFVEVVVADELKLLKHYYSYVKEGAYNAALDMGNNEDKILIKSEYYLFMNSALVKMPTTRKKFIKLFSENKQDAIASFIDEKIISLKDHDDLIAMCDFLNARQIPLVAVN